MAMTFTAITQDPVLVEEGTFTMNFKASGAILAGQAVCCSGGTELVKVNQVTAANVLGGGFVGIALNTVADGEYVAVIPPGNKVRVRASGAIGVGEGITPVSKGFFQNITYKGSGSYGVCLEAITDGSYGKVLLY